MIADSAPMVTGRSCRSFHKAPRQAGGPGARGMVLLESRRYCRAKTAAAVAGRVQGGAPRMIDRYTAVGLQTTFLNVQSKADYQKNLKHIGEVFDAAMYLCRLEFPVKLVCIAEAAIQTFVDSRLQFDHVRAARE